MPDAPLIDQIAERVERLLVRHEELLRTAAILHEQVSTLTRERDSLKSRLMAARARVDALIERLPAPTPVPMHQNQDTAGLTPEPREQETAP